MVMIFLDCLRLNYGDKINKSLSFVFVQGSNIFIMNRDLMIIKNNKKK